MRGSCLNCGKETSRGRGTYCRKCFLERLRTHGFEKPRYHGPWRFYCEVCGKRAGHNCHVCRECRRGRHKMEMNSNWENFKSNNPAAGGRRAKRRKKLGKCERCRKRPATDRHHKDANKFNNSPSNLMGLCRKCHMIIDGRIKRRNEKGWFA